MNDLKGTEIGTIARNWKVVDLGSVCEPPQYGFTATAQEKGNVRFLRITDIGDVSVRWDNVPYCDCTIEEIEKYRLQSGDIVFARIGATTGKSYLIENPPDAVFASYLIRVRTKPDMNPVFLSHFFHSSGYWRQVDAYKNANLKKGVSGSLLKTLSVPVPPLSEQRKIAAVLSLVQRAIEQQERLIALTTELKKALMHKLFTEGLRGEPLKMTEIGPVPESWEEATLGQFATKPHGVLQTGPFGSQLHKNEYQDSGIPVVNPTHLAGNRINHEDVPRVTLETAKRLERHILRKGDILFGRRGEIGRHGLVTAEEDGWLCGTGCFLVRVRSERLDNRFLSYYFSTSQIVTWLNSHAAGAIMPNLNNTVLRQMPVCFPAFEDQLEIADCLDTVEQKIQIAESKRDALRDLFHTLLHQLMTAQIRVHNLELEWSADIPVRHARVD
ncbi:restriction endonuclease subunit S [candidate division KSB1 bacterium]|nr:restriction endonuclease subunit S [candidate division KSB1 bacterium]